MAFELITDDPNEPPPCIEACCFDDGSCADMGWATCVTSGGTPWGPGTNCGSVICPMLLEACCLPDGSCANLRPADCYVQGGHWPPSGVCLGDLNTNGVDDACEEEPPEYRFEFSLDIGSDTEMSDPLADGDEAFDPGDVYWWQGPPVLPPGRDGFKDDALIFGSDPRPDPPDPTGSTRVPVGSGSSADYMNYFDLDAHDQIDVDLWGSGWIPSEDPLPEPIPEFGSTCIHEAHFLMISLDDDMGPGWPVQDVPVMVPSPFAGMTYGMTPGQDEILGVTVAPIGGPPPYPVLGIYPIADEIMVHQSLVPNPDAGDLDDDDVDSLDIVPGDVDCPFWYFSPDHEGNYGLDPGGIYQVTASGPMQVIDEFIHLGVPEEADIDAFEFVWVEDPAEPGMLKLGLAFSVDDDDPQTGIDESGGMDPTVVFVSYLTGYNIMLTDPMPDDVDALTVWWTSLNTDPCPGDCNGDRSVDLLDHAAFVGCMFGPNVPYGTGCECVDLDFDSDVDLVDFSAFQDVFGFWCP
jgi:hypothetical protein